MYVFDGENVVTLNNTAGERQSVIVHTDGTIKIQNSESATSTSTKYYRLDASGYKLTEVSAGNLTEIQNFEWKVLVSDTPSDYRLDVSPKESALSIEMGQTLDITFTLYHKDQRISEWDQPQLSIKFEGSESPVSYEEWEKMWAGSYLLKVKGLEPGTAVLTICDNASGAIAEVTVNILPVDETEFDDPSKAEWVEKHIQYATSSTYQEQIVDGFPGALQESFEVIKNDKNITVYNTLDKFNDVLGFNISDLSETQKYELLLTQILFSRNGVTSIENVYNQYLNENALDIIRTLLNDPDFIAGVDDKEIRELKENLNVIEKALPMGIDCAETINNVLQKIKTINTKPVSTCINLLKDSKLDLVLGFINDQQSTLATTVDELIMYLAAGDAYMRTSVAFGEVLLNMRRYLNIPSDLVDIYPQALSGETLLAMLGRDIPGGYPNGYDVTNPFDIPISIRELCWAIENIYVNLEAYKQDSGKLIAKKALETYKQGSILNVYGTGMGVAASIMECVPLLEAFSVVKKFFDGTQFAIDLFTEIDDKAAHGTMVMRLYCIARVHYLTVNSLATSTTLWGKTTSLDTVDRNKQYDMAMLFDESVAVYRAILNVASEYAQQYHAGGHNLPQGENHNYVIQPGMISPLEAQQKFFNYDWCHQSLEEYLEESGTYSWDPKNLVIYEVKCPVEVIVKDTSDTVIAVLRNGNSQIAKGYERYFFITETVRDSGDYLKIAMVPKTFAVTIEGTDIGWMNAAVTDYANQQIGETRFFYNVPITDKTIGNFVNASNTSIVKELIVDNVTFEGDAEIPVKHVASENWIFDTINHWHTCAGCDVKLDVSSHSGGTATCTKKAVCTVCGTSYGELASHDYETSWSQGDTNGHWHECKNCSAHDTQIKHTPGAVATENTAQICTECGYVIVPATGHVTHTAGSKWFSDGNSHWHKCTGCNEKLDVTTHSGGTATCTKKAVCTVCGTSYGKLASHDYEKNWSQGDANGHWHECKNCSAHDTQVRHTPGAAATETTAQFCTVCDYVITPALGHTCTAGSKWYSNGTYHWHACTSCGAWVKTSYHSYSSDTDKTCNVCGYTRTATVTEPTKETEVAMTETTEATDPGEEVIATETAPMTVPTEANENLSDDAVSEDTDSRGVSGVLITVFAIVALGSLAVLVILLVYKKRRKSE